MLPTPSTQNLMQLWRSTPPEVRELLTPIQSVAQYRKALATFEALLTEVETQPEPSADTLELFHLLGEHLHAYEQRESLPAAEGREVLRFLLEQHGLKQSDVPEVGSQGVVSEVLSGKRPPNVRQAKAMAERFKVKFSVFLT